MLSGSVWAQASCPIDLSGARGLEDLNKMKLAMMPTTSDGKACNIRVGDGTAKDNGQKTLYFQNGHPCLLTVNDGSKPEPQCDQNDNGASDPNNKFSQMMNGDDKMASLSASLSSKSSENTKDLPEVVMQVGKDQSGKQAIFIFKKDKNGKVDKSNYLKILQASSGKNDCEIQTYSNGTQVGDLNSKVTAGGSTGGSCAGKNGSSIKMVGDSTLNFDGHGVYPVVNEDKPSYVGDHNGAPTTTNIVQNVNGGGAAR